MPADRLGVCARREHRVRESRRQARGISNCRFVAAGLRRQILNQEPMRSVKQSVLICVPFILMTMLSHVTAQTRRQTVDLLLVGGTIVTMDETRRVIDDGGIAVSNGRIVAIGP